MVPARTTSETSRFARTDPNDLSMPRSSMTAGLTLTLTIRSSAPSGGFAAAILLWGEQLSPVSSTECRLPANPVAHHRVENRQQLPHAGHQRDFPRLAGSGEAREEGPDHGIAADRGQRGHVQRRTNRGSAAPDVPRAALLPTVPVQRRDADQGGNLAAIEAPQLRQVGEGGCREDGAAARRRAQQVLALPPHRTGANQRLQRLLDVAQLLAQPLHMLLDVLPYLRRAHRHASFFRP